MAETIGHAVDEKQPKAFYMIFIVEFWERFGYYVMNTLIVFYFFIEYLGFEHEHAYNLFGAFCALLWTYIIIGGYIGDKYFGTKRTMTLGAVLLFIGYFCLAGFGGDAMYISLGMIAVGEGMFKANPSSLLAKCYKENDSRLHIAYTYYYMAINIGALLATILAPLIAEYLGWKIGFYLAGIGMICALCNFWIMRKTVSGIGSVPDSKPFSFKKLIITLILCVILIYITSILLETYILAFYLTYAICIVAVIAYFVFAFKLKESIDTKKMIVAFILILEAFWFYTLYQQMYLSITSFGIQNVYQSFLGIPVAGVTYQGFDPLVIIIFSPLFAMYFKHNTKKGKSLKITTKFSIGFFLLTIAYLILYISTYFGGADAKVSSLWLLLFYCFQGAGEILIAALGLAMVAELIVDKYVGFVYGVFFFASAIGAIIGAQISDMSIAPKGATVVQSMSIFQGFFLQLCIVSLVVAIIIYFIRPILNKYMIDHSTETT